MATFNETGSGGILLSGSIILVFTATCFNLEMLQVKGEEYMFVKNANNNREPAFIPNIVTCRQPDLRAKIASKNFSSRE